MYQCIGYENLFGLFIKSENKNIQNINLIGLAGFVSVSNDYYNG